MMNVKTLFCLVLVVALASAHNHNPPHGGHNPDRTIDFDMDGSGNDMSFTKPPEDSTLQDAYTLRFRVESGMGPLVLRLGVLNADLTERPRGAMSLLFGKAYDFSDANGDGEFQPNEVNTEYDLAQTGWDPMSCNQTTIDSVEVYECVATHSTLPLTFTFFTGVGAFRKNNMTIEPSALKFDFELGSGFPWAASDSRLALGVAVLAPGDGPRRHQHQQMGPRMGGGLEFSGLCNITWVDDAEDMSGNAIEVLASSVTNDGEQDGLPRHVMFFSFDAEQPDYILWDPELASTYEEDETSPASRPIATSLALVLALFASLAALLF